MTSAWDDKKGPDEDNFAIDGSGKSIEDIGGQQGTVDKEGWYHFEIADVIPELDTTSKQGKEKTPAIRFDLQVLQSVDNQSPAGSRHFHRIYVAGSGGKAPAEGSVKSALRFGLGIGILKEIEHDGHKHIVEAWEGSPRIGIKHWKAAKGMQIVAKIVSRPAEGNYPASWEIPFARCYRPGDSSVVDVPLNIEALGLAKQPPAGLIAPPSAAAPEKSRPTGTPEAATVAVGSLDDLSDL